MTMVGHAAEGPCGPKYGAVPRRYSTLVRDINLVLLILVLAVFIMTILASQWRGQELARERQGIEGQQLFSLLQSRIARPLSDADLLETTALAEIVLQDPRVVSIRVFTANKALPFLELSGGPRDEVRLFSETVILEKQPVGSLQMDVSLAPYRENLQVRLQETIFIALIVLGTIALFGRFLVRYFLLRPLGILLEGVDEYAQGNYDFTFPKVQQVELVHVINRVQEMAQRMEDRKESLQASNRILLQEVQDRRRTEDALQQLQQLLASIIDSVPAFLVTLDENDRVMQWNRQAENWTGIASAEAQGRDFFALLPNLNRQRKKMLGLLNRGVGQDHIRLQNPFPAIGGDFEMEINPLSGSVRGGAVIRIEDVSERLRLQENMVQAEKMSSVGGLAAGMAHEINNPLAIIMQNTELLEQRLDTQNARNIVAADGLDLDLAGLEPYLQQRKIDVCLSAMREAADRANQIVTNMLSFSRKGVAQMTRCRVSDLVENVLDLAAKDFDATGGYDFRQINVIRHYASELPDMYCRASQIQQVLLNLFKNSAQAMAGISDEAPTLTISLYPEGSLIRLEVADNGPGMEEGTRRRIFEPFFTTREGEGGTGLGLAVSYFIITETHHGSMEVESAPGSGTRFIIRLPAGVQEETISGE